MASRFGLRLWCHSPLRAFLATGKLHRLLELSVFGITHSGSSRRPILTIRLMLGITVRWSLGQILCQIMVAHHSFRRPQAYLGLSGRVCACERRGNRWRGGRVASLILRTTLKLEKCIGAFVQVIAHFGDGSKGLRRLALVLRPSYCARLGSSSLHLIR